MAGLGVHRRYDPPRHHTARYAPPARHLGVGLDVLAGHHRQQRRRLGLLLCELRAVERVEHPLGVGDQIIYEPRPLVGVVPVTHRPGPSVVVMAQHQPSRRRRQAAHTPNLRADHRDGVLGRDRVEQHRGGPAPASSCSTAPALSGHLAHRVEDPLRAPAGAQPLAHSVNTLASKPPSSMPSPPRPSSAHRSAAAPAPRGPNTLQRLQNHHHRDHRPRHRRPPRGPKRSSNNPSGNNLRRFSAKNRCTDPSRHQPPHKPRCPTVPDPASQCPAYPMIPHHTHDREHPTRITQHSPSRASAAPRRRRASRRTCGPLPARCPRW